MRCVSTRSAWALKRGTWADCTATASSDVLTVRRSQRSTSPGSSNATEAICLLSRPALLGLLADALPDGVVRFGSPVRDVDELRSQYDVLIGADGIRSVVRTKVFGDVSDCGSPVQRCGAVWPMSTAPRAARRGEQGSSWMTPYEPGQTNWYAVLTAPEGYRPPGDDVTELRRLFGDWHDPIPSILDQYDASEVLRHDLRTWTRRCAGTCAVRSHCWEMLPTR